MTKASVFLFCITTVITVRADARHTFESDLLSAGLSLSQQHSEEFARLYRGQFFGREGRRAGRKKGKARTKARAKRAFWGLDKFFSDAMKAKNHFGGLKDRVGGLLGSGDSQV